MSKNIVWTSTGIKSLNAVLDFWDFKNKSTEYSKKLNALIKNKVEFLAKFPFTGKQGDFLNLRVKVVENHLIFYKVEPNEIVIYLISHSKQNIDFENYF